MIIPCPRLEFRWRKVGDSWKNRECSYSLVLPLSENDARREEGKKEITLEIGLTAVSGGNGSPPISRGKVDAPFRDYAHAMWDRNALGNHLPVVAVCGNVISMVDLPKEFKS